MDFYNDPNYAIQINELEKQFELNEKLEESYSTMFDVISDNLDDFINEQVEEYISEDEHFKELLKKELIETLQITERR